MGIVILVGALFLIILLGGAIITFVPMLLGIVAFFKMLDRRIERLPNGISPRIQWGVCFFICLVLEIFLWVDYLN